MKSCKPEATMIRPTKSGKPVAERRSLHLEIALAVLLALLILGGRLMIDVPNFKPVMAIALLAGFLFSRRLLGTLSVVAGMLLSDLVIGFYDGRVAIVVYLALACPIVAGVFLKRWSNHTLKMSAGVAGFAGLAALNFYLLTTLAVWSCFEWYPANLAGLGLALWMGLPFLKWSLFGNIVFAGLLFGGAGLLHAAWTLPGKWSPNRPVSVQVRK